MLPEYHKLPVSAESSFIYKSWECEYFDKPWHFHKEYELVLINKSEGARFIGDKVDPFKNGDIFLIGPNIPHLFRNSERYYKKKGLVAKSIFIHFTDDFLGKPFFDLPEMQMVRRLLDKSCLGLEIKGISRQYVNQILINMEQEAPPKRLLNLLDILLFLSTSKEVKTILTSGFTATNSSDTARIDIVMQFIMKNYNREIYVTEIASKLNMTVPSFSRYVKRHTKKTFSEIISDVRIGYACKLLMEDNYSISEICYQSGFDNLSNFYRHFSKKKGVVPKEFRKRFLLQ
jgi:AraC-like DNA-binding protein